MNNLDIEYIKYLQKLEEDGDLDAQKRLELDIIKDFYYTFKAAKNGDTKNQRIMGMLYLFGSSIVERDIDEAIKYFSSAYVNGGDVASMIYLAQIYMDFSDYKSKKIGKELLYEAKLKIKDDDTYAQSALGNYYLKNQDTYNEAFECFAKIIEVGSIENLMDFINFLELFFFKKKKGGLFNKRYENKYFNEKNKYTLLQEVERIALEMQSSEMARIISRIYSESYRIRHDTYKAHLWKIRAERWERRF